MSSSKLGRLVLTTLAISAAVGACGGSSASPATVPGTPSATLAGATTAAGASPAVGAISTTAASATCPTAATVDAALGTSLPAPIGIAGGGAALPAGATGIACEYHGATANVLIQLISNISPTSISLFSAKFPVPFKNVSGVGDQARSFSQPLGAGKDNEGVVATKGMSLVAITATDTPASLKQVEALVNQLL
jgi:hypothetical protein